MGDALYRSGFGDVWKGEWGGQSVAVKVIRAYSQGDSEKMVGVRYRLYYLLMCRCADTPVQRFCKEVVTWKSLHHLNVLPLMGVTMTDGRFEVVSEWMVNGNINEFLKKNPDADRLKLVSVPFEVQLFLPRAD